MKIERVVVVKRRTGLEELERKFQTRAQARFYLEQSGQEFAALERDHQLFSDALREIQRAIPSSLKFAMIDRDLLGDYRFQAKDAVVTVGPDGLVVNVAKYLDEQPILAVNPDPTTIDGILLPLAVGELRHRLMAVAVGKHQAKLLTMGSARFADGRELLAVNDFFVGAANHVSARYRIEQNERSEDQSSSGIIVSTGVGSSGWMRSVFEGALGAARGFGIDVKSSDYTPMPWDAERLRFAVREPFPSKISQTTMTFGEISNAMPLKIESQMASNGVIFSDGVQSDYMDFTSGSSVEIGLANRKAHLVV